MNNYGEYAARVAVSSEPTTDDMQKTASAKDIFETIDMELEDLFCLSLSVDRSVNGNLSGEPVYLDKNSGDACLLDSLKRALDNIRLIGNIVRHISRGIC